MVLKSLVTTKTMLSLTMFIYTLYRTDWSAVTIGGPLWKDWVLVTLP